MSIIAKVCIAVIQFTCYMHRIFIPAIIYWTYRSLFKYVVFGGMNYPEDRSVLWQQYKHLLYILFNMWLQAIVFPFPVIRLLLKSSDKVCKKRNQIAYNFDFAHFIITG